MMTLQDIIAIIAAPIYVELLTKRMVGAPGQTTAELADVAVRQAQVLWDAIAAKVPAEP